MHIVVIGGGASGLAAAIKAKRSDNKVTILEKNDICGKKILATGNGRCNYYNDNQNLENYNSTNKELLPNIINSNNLKKVTMFFDEVGIIPKIKDGYYYPTTNQAVSVKNSLLLQAQVLGVEIKNNFSVTDVEKLKDKFIIKGNDYNLTADKVIISTGSYASFKTKDNVGYKILQKFGHSIVPIVPSLVQLKSEGKFLKLWNGVRSDVRLYLYEDNNLYQEEKGQIQLTDYGISGICTFNISGKVSRGLLNNKKEQVKIDFIPFIDVDGIKDFTTYFSKRDSKLNSRNLDELLQGILNHKLEDAILTESKISKNKKWSDLTEKEIEKLYHNLKKFSLNITGTNSFDKAQVCSGGIPLTEINTKTMESLKVSNLYITGELLDVDGLCGGYNLTFSWITGILAGGCAAND